MWHQKFNENGCLCCEKDLGSQLFKKGRRTNPRKHLELEEICAKNKTRNLDRPPPPQQFGRSHKKTFVQDPLQASVCADFKAHSVKMCKRNLKGTNWKTVLTRPDIMQMAKVNKQKACVLGEENLWQLNTKRDHEEGIWNIIKLSLEIFRKNSCYSQN